MCSTSYGDANRVLEAHYNASKTVFQVVLITRIFHQQL
jgi:hypothetical protein